MELEDLWRASMEVAESNPRRHRPDVDQAWPRRSLTAIRESLEVELLQTLEHGSARLVGNALVLHRALVIIRGAADHERDLRVAPEVRDLPGLLERVEEDLAVVCHDDSND